MTEPAVIVDQFGRRLRNLRISVTDRCNLRCNYCMPEEEYAWLPREDILSFEEICQLVDVFVDLGVDKVRLTGGEPLLRKDLPRLVAMLAARPGLADLAMTTNGVLLAEHAPALRGAGLGRVTVSLDTLRPERFRALTRRDTHARVLEGIAAVREAGWPGLKIDTVVIRGVNDDELVDLIEYGRRVEGEVRFIEYMDVGGATAWSMDQVVSRAEMLRRPRSALRDDRVHPRGWLSPGGALPPAGRDDLRHHRVDHAALLPILRPEPPHRRRHVVPVPVREGRARSGRGAAGWGEP